MTLNEREVILNRLLSGYCISDELFIDYLQAIISGFLTEELYDDLTNVHHASLANVFRLMLFQLKRILNPKHQDLVDEYVAFDLSLDWYTDQWN